MTATSVQLITAAHLPELREHWLALYAHQQMHGMKLPVKSEFYEAWAANISPLLGRFTAVSTAVSGSEVVGFAAGRIKALPAWFGGGQAGFVSEVYVAEHARGQHLTRRLLDSLGGFFSAQGVERIELQVIGENHHAKDVYAHLGWQVELTQMVHRLP